MYQFVEPVVDKLGSIYKELITEKERVEKVIKVEEERFLRTLDRAEQIFEDIVAHVKSQDSKVIPGQEVLDYTIPLVCPLTS